MYECKVRKCTILHLQKQGVLHIFTSVVFDSLALTLCHFITYTGKSFSEVLILASNNPQFDKRLSSELPIQNMKIPSSEHGENTGKT